MFDLQRLRRCVFAAPLGLGGLGGGAPGGGGGGGGGRPPRPPGRERAMLGLASLETWGWGA
ncbi:hypothetical protein, partial [Nocardia asiatica]|uniref:hypothetical protein n=1 Tax=Nocardia asiatica TaxID=209252 RepID=UPI00245843BB